MTSLLLLLLASADEIHVSPGGDDAAAGTAAAPFRTLGRARDAARKIIKAGLNADLVVRIAAGRYELEAPLVLGPGDSGTGTHRVIWTGPGAVISGGRRVSGWTRGKDGTWTLSLPENRPFRSLFIGGRRRPRARTPDEGYYRIVKAGPDDRTSFTFEEGHLRAWSRLREAEVVFLHDWSSSRIRIASVDESAREVKLLNPVGPGARHYSMTWFEKQPRYFVENAPELLDRPGEWYADGGRLRAIPEKGEDLRRTETVVPVLERLLEVRGPIRNVVFRGLTFAHTDWQVPKGGYAAGQAAYHEDRDHGEKAGHRAPVPPAILVENAEGCVFERCGFEQLGGTGLWLARGSHRNRITDCTFTDIAANGVMIGLGGEARRGGDGVVCRGNVLERSRIERCGALYYGAVGVWVGITDSTVISRNTIRHLPYTGVSVGWSWNPSPTPARGNRVEHNHIHHVMQILSDGGGIYTLGRQPDSALRGNHIHDVPLNAGRAESNGIFMDEGTTDFRVEDNVIWNVVRSPIRFHKAGANTLRNNTLVVPEKKVPPFRYNNSSEKDKTFEGNRVVAAPEFAAPAPPETGPR